MVLRALSRDFTDRQTDRQTDRDRQTETDRGEMVGNKAEPENGVDALVGLLMLQLPDDGVASLVRGLHRRQQEHRGCNERTNNFFYL